jgi:hypothetical protein
MAALATLGCAAATAASGDPTGGLKPSIMVNRPLIGLVRIGQRLTVTGRVRNAPRGLRIALQQAEWALFRSGGSWRVLASTTAGRHGAFRVSWRVRPGTAIGPLELRLVAIRKRWVVVAGSPWQSAVGSAAVYCRPAQPQAGVIPAGDGWIVGGVYDQGGAFPGIYQCAGSPYTVSATDASGKVLARQSVAALHGYRLVVPAGSYTLTSGSCRGVATVTAGRPTRADTDCDFP